MTLDLTVHKEGNVLFNDALNTFYLWLYGVRHMVKNHMGYSFQLAARVILHTTAFVTPVVEHWLEREIAQWVRHKGSIRRPIAP